MPFAIGFRLIAHKDQGLKNALPILARNLRGGMEGLGKRLKASAETRMRRDRGDSQKSLRIEVKTQQANIQLTVYSTLVQAFVDAYGMGRGKFPPFGVGSNIYKWAERKAAGNESKKVRLEGSNERVLSSLTRRPRARTARPLAKVNRIKRTKNVTLNSDQRRRAKKKDAKRLAFLAARVVFERGIRPTHWNKKALDANQARILQEIRNALSRAATEISRG